MRFSPDECVTVFFLRSVSAARHSETSAEEILVTTHVGDECVSDPIYSNNSPLGSEAVNDEVLSSPCFLISVFLAKIEGHWEVLVQAVI